MWCSTKGDSGRLWALPERRLATVDHQAHLQLFKPLVEGKDGQREAGELIGFGAVPAKNVSELTVTALDCSREHGGLRNR